MKRVESERAGAIKAILFDAYGTLFDVYSIGVLAEELFPGQGSRIAEKWRDTQIEYSRLRTLSGRYRPFSQLTEDALTFALRKLGVESNAQQRHRLLRQYDRLDVFPENLATLKELRSRGLPLGILSNGDPGMLQAVLSHAGFVDLFDHILSAHAVERFKTAPEVYQLGVDAFGVAAKDILFVSSNCWDACGATWFGYTSLWINRGGAPLEELGIAPHRIGSTLRDTVTFVESLNPIRFAPKP